MTGLAAHAPPPRPRPPVPPGAARLRRTAHAFDERLWVNIGDLIFGPARWRAAPEEAAAVARLLALAPGAAVLDIPCGTGRHSLAFAGNGCRPTAVERCAAYLDEARARADALGRSVEWVEADMRAFRRPAAFDAAVNLNTSFGYFRSDRDNLQVLRNLHDSLRPGGRILIDLTIRDQLSRSLKPRKSYRAATAMFEEANRLSDDGKWLAKKIVVTRGGIRQSFGWGRRVYSAGEITQMLALAGFDEIRLLHGFTDRPYSAHSDRLTAIGRKRVRPALESTG